VLALPFRAAFLARRPSERANLLHKTGQGIDQIIAHQAVVDELTLALGADEAGIFGNAEML